MNWTPWRKAQKFEAFVGYVTESETSGDQLMRRALDLANELGLKGMKIESIERRNSLTGDPSLSSIWFLGTEKK